MDTKLPNRQISYSIEMSDKCKYKADCTNPQEEGCLLGLRDFRECSYQNKGKQDENTSITNVEQLEEFELPINWTGNSMGEIDLKTISYKKRPYIIGLIGPSNSGKTTLLATLYMLLRSGKRFQDFSFAGSNTLIGWENIAYFLTYKAGNLIQFPPHTSRNSGRIPGMLHLKLKDNFGLFHDILFTDAPGEWFTDWANKSDDNNAVGARWINENTDAFVLFADCQAFIEDIGNTRLALKSIAERLRNDIRKRPVVLTWTKSDLNVDPEIKIRIGEVICNLFPIKEQFEVSVKGAENSDLHDNIIKLFDWIFQEVFNSTNTPLFIEPKSTTDFFFVKR